MWRGPAPRATARSRNVRTSRRSCATPPANGRGANWPGAGWRTSWTRWPEMARRDDLPALNALAEIRAAQAAAAASVVADAHRASNDADARLQDERDVQAGRSDAWSAIMAAPRLDLLLSQAWAQAVVAGEAQVDRAALGARRAQDGLDRARAEAQRADARREGAEALARSALRRERRRADE